MDDLDADVAGAEFAWNGVYAENGVRDGEGAETVGAGDGYDARLKQNFAYFAEVAFIRGLVGWSRGAPTSLFRLGKSIVVLFRQL